MNYVHTTIGADCVLSIVLDRPPANALTPDVYRQLIHAFRSIDADEGVNAVVLSSSGGRFFSGGIDLKETADQNDTYRRERAQVGRDCFEVMRDVSVPVVCAVEGQARGAGCALAASCDVIVAAETASFGLPEVDVGVVGGISPLLHLLPRGVLSLMLFTGEPIDADEAYRHGLVQKLAAPGDAVGMAQDLAATIAAKNPTAVRLMKHAIRYEHLMSSREASRFEHALNEMFSVSDDAKLLRESAAASVSARRPRTPADHQP